MLLHRWFSGAARLRQDHDRHDSSRITPTASSFRSPLSLKASARVREIIAAAEERLELGRQTILFVDEIHRFNKAQQDAFLPHVESGHRHARLARRRRIRRSK